MIHMLTLLKHKSDVSTFVMKLDRTHDNRKSAIMVTYEHVLATKHIIRSICSCF